MKRKCSHCHGTGKVELCAFCKGKPSEREEAATHCDSCKKPVCDDHRHIGEDCDYCDDCWAEVTKDWGKLAL